MQKPLVRAALLATAAGLAWLMIAQTGTGNLESSGQSPFWTTNDTSTSFAGTADTRSTTAPTRLYSLGPVSGKRLRSVEATPYGTGTATTTFDYQVWAVKRGFTIINGTTTVDYERRLFCHGTATLGTTTGAASSGGILTTDKICDTLTVVTDPYGIASCAAYGAPTPFVYSPGSNGMARLFLPDLGNAGDLEFTVDMTGATSGNFLVERGN